MIILGLSKVDRNAQNPLELVSYLSLLVPLQATKSRDDLINSRFLFIERSVQSIEGNPRSVKTRETEIFSNFSGNRF